MGTVSVSLPPDGTTADVADYNTPINTIVNEFNGNIDNANIKSGAAIATSKLADDAGIGTAKLADGGVTSRKLAPSVFRTALSYSMQSNSVETTKSTISIPSQSVDSVVLFFVSISASLGNGTPTLNWETRIRRTNSSGTVVAYAQGTKDAANSITQRASVSLLGVDQLAASTARDYVLTDASNIGAAINAGSSWVALVLNDDGATLA